MVAFNTVWPADSVEFCPREDSNNILVCGTYYLEPSKPTEAEAEGHSEPQDLDIPKAQKRYGKIILLETSQVENETALQQIQAVDLPAVLDLKWCHRESSVQPVLASADSEGGIKLFEYHIAEKGLTLMQSIACSDTQTLCLSIDWSNRKSLTTGLGSLVVSRSDGNITLFRPGSSGLVSCQTWHAHDYEPWIAAWNYWDTNVVYTGGDDLKMKAWDVREECSQPMFTSTRFEGGVTSIQSHTYIEHLIAVGSYDNTVRLFDVRRPFRPLIQTDVGGGAWRVKWHPSPSRKHDLLVASMHDGAKVVRFQHGILGQPSSVEQAEIVQRFDKHDSMAYGVDWCYGSEATQTLIASCSFYDHVLHTWKG